ncbi:MAG: Ig-like domain-containing protein, partial [bacterium]
MNTVPRLLGILPLLSALMLIGFACSDDEGPTDGGEVDNSPPKIASAAALNSNNVQIEIDEKVNKESAERTENYLITKSTSYRSDATSAAPGDTSPVGTAVLLSGGRKVLLSTWTSMSNIGYVITIKNVQDLNGNRMTTAATRAFTGSTAPDDIAPEIVSRSPVPDATNVGTAQSVVVKFSEPMNNSTVFGAFAWTYHSTAIPVTMEERGNEFVFTPLLSLQLNTDYNVSISGGAEDWAGNSLAATTWSFRTTSMPD